ncbi:dienelactone hydrolase [Tepidicaulis marinus]|uniref:Dienelactone hydrolase n=1 Tax=Tepidicaulis marinus TaxID=1333998 RepID=A0A081BD27_9HYPH|nr:dienelactone hydrolase family protein [Tepidicaulis marinus]GAK45945.1 dienelactone hydrolase [Tepidicaulis marinus]
MTHKGSMSTIKGSGGDELAAYFVEAEGTRKGGLVLIQEIFGVTDHIKELCDGFAADGYDVIAPSMYDRDFKNWQAEYTEEGMQQSIKLAQGTGLTYAKGDVQAAIDFLKERGNERVHITGYCYGGSVAWFAACNCEGLTSAVGYYGRLIMEMDTQKPRCPTMLHFGEKDKSIPIDWVRKFKEERPDITVHIYDADHGFNSDRRQHYDPEATKLARERTLEWFEKA